MARHRPYLSAAAMLAAFALLAADSATRAQSPPQPQPGDTGVTADEDMTLVVATRIVAPTDQSASPKVMFDKARVPEASFNATDRCIDEHALEIAQEYFTSLGRMLGTSAVLYVVPDEDVAQRVAICEKQHGHPPQAWVAGKTQVVAYGRMVPTAAAAELEQSLR
jgi:hypothetical protein